MVRFAVALCTLMRQPVHIFRIRDKRARPGLRPQHLQSIRACASLCSGRLEGDSVDSREIAYYPGEALRSGAFHWDIGTAGSATMMAFTLIPIALFAPAQSQFTIRGGLFQDFAPTAFHMQKVLAPLLGRMGAAVRIEVLRPGYVPRGSGELLVSIEPLAAPLTALDLSSQGGVRKIGGISLASHLEREQVALRMAERCRSLLAEKGYEPELETIIDSTAFQRGASLLLWAETETGCVLGSDRAGKRGRSSESIADQAVGVLLEDLASGATVDRFAADQMILFAGLASGRSEYVIPRMTDHVEANVWLAERILGAVAHIRGNHICIDGIGYFGK